MNFMCLTKTINHFFFLLLLALVSVSCDNTKESDNSDQYYYENELIKKTERYNLLSRARRVPKNILNEIHKKSDNQGGNLVLGLVTRNDCSGCRRKTYSVLTRIERLTSGRTVVLGEGISPNEFDHEEFTSVYVEDVSFQLRNRLGLFQTPTIILVDSEGQIKDIITFFTFGSTDQYSEDKAITDFIAEVVFD